MTGELAPGRAVAKRRRAECNGRASGLFGCLQIFDLVQDFPMPAIVWADSSKPSG